MIEIFRKASLCRNFENETFKQIQQKNITFPTYLSAGQEYIASSLSHYLEKHNPHIFIQHRGHSTYLAFGGKVEDLIDELLNIYFEWGLPIGYHDEWWDYLAWLCYGDKNIGEA